MQKQFDLVVIGSGAAGGTVADRCREAGWRVAVVDVNPFGGTCANRGCDPKKVLIAAAHAAEAHNRMQEKDIFDHPLQPNWPALMAFKRTFTDPVPEATVERFEEAGIETFHGRARFTGPNTLVVGEDELEARHVVIAAGARPRPLNIDGEEYVATSTDFLALSELPNRIVFIGGGYISFEFAHIAARAGAQVTILHRSAQPLKQFDADLVEELMKTTRELGVEIRLDAPVTRVEKQDDSFVVHTRSKDQDDGSQDAPQTFAADIVFHGAGRVPEIKALDLDAAGVESSRDGVTVNEFMQSVSNPAVYAAGDAAASGLPLTPIASIEGGIVADNLLHGNQHRRDYSVIPTTVFTIPALAAVGMREEEAREQGLNIDVQTVDMSTWATSRRLGISHALAKVVSEADSGKILGAHLFGPNVEETINLFALAMHTGMSKAELAKMVFAYPTASSDVKYIVG